MKPNFICNVKGHDWVAMGFSLWRCKECKATFDCGTIGCPDDIDCQECLITLPHKISKGKQV